MLKTICFAMKNNEIMKTLNRELTLFLKSQGASLIGFADLHEIDSETRDGFPTGISIAIALNPQVMSGIKTGPTKEYNAEYIRMNTLLDTIAQLTVVFLGEKGHSAKARFATVEEDEATLTAKLPHKTVATRAGLGWVGKSNLLITENYGSAVRLVTVLTDAPLAAGKSVNSSRCGGCTACVDICPAHTLTGNLWQAGVSRESLVDVLKCRIKARGMTLKTIGESKSICGLCIVTCPWTQKYLKKAV
jgi:epoxyqueuosine reductase